MAKRQKLKEKLYPGEGEGEEEEEEEGKLKSVAVMTSDDDDEANEDLSLKIVEKHLMMRTAKLDQDDDVVDDNNKNDSVVVAGPSGAADDVLIEDVKSDKKKTKVRKKKKKEVENIEIGDQSVTVVEEEQKVEAVDNGDEADIRAVDISDNIVLRKLLRGPRYFDPPDSGWQTCYNCGEEGHMAVNCTSAVKRKKPCFVCGSLDHGVKQCSKAQDCFICKKGGHRAKYCPDKHSRNAQVCLKCGDSGHDLFSCTNNYSLDDLKEVQCYICKSFGHLCCVNVTDAGLKEVSCFRCGRLGHTGMACARSHSATAEVSPSSCYKCGGEGHFARECVSSAEAWARSHSATTEVSPSSCYKCGGEGHFARECESSAEAWSRSHRATTEVSPSSCYKCGGKGHFARECVSSAMARKRNIDTSTPALKSLRENKDYFGVKSAPHDLGKSRKKKKTQHEERGITTPRKSKQRGGWRTDDPGDTSYAKPKKNHWRSPGTPSSNGHKMSSVTSGGHFSSPHSKKWTSYHKYSASRFDNGSDGIRRSYDWW